MSIFLSICIPTYNRHSSLKAQIDFLLHEGVQEYDDVEVIIANNGSSDGTKAYLLDEVDGKYPNFYVVNSDNNIGLINNFRKLRDMATGEYFWLVGDDDVMRVGIVRRVMSIVYEYDVDHIFINHAMVQGERVKTDQVFSGESGYIKNGLEAFEQLTNRSSQKLGGLMFITANVFRRSLTIDADKILAETDETENLALPLGYSLYCCLKGSSYIVDDVYIYDQVDSTSWSDKRLLVHCRDMLAICDKLAEHEGHGERIRRLLIHSLPTWAPEYKYIFCARKFDRDNYALKWYRKYYKTELIKDVFRFALRTPLAIMRRLIMVLRHI